MKEVLTLIIPVYNEGSNLPGFVPEVMEKSIREGWSVIFIDDCSTDNTGRLLKEFSEKYDFQHIRNKRNKGYGGAIKEGVKIVKTEWLVTVDADGQHDLNDINRLLEYLQDNDADMVVGRRDRKASSLYRRFGKLTIRILAKILIGNSVRDINSGLKLYSTKLAQKYIKICPDGMAYSESIMFCFHIQKHLVMELPVTVRKREKDKSTVTLKTAFQTIIEIFNLVMLFNPLNLFLPVALVCILFGIVWGLPILLDDRGVSVGSMLAIVSGLLSIFLGLIAEQLSKLRISSL